MKRISKWGILGIATGTLFVALIAYAATPWDLKTWSGGRCNIIGCSACRGANNHPCGAKERYCSYTCQGDKAPTNKCMVDDGC
jgi:hypothetical protein